MPPRTSVSSALSWRCPQCTIRSFSSSARQLAVGPEHPRYINIPEPPQQTVPDRPPVKGILPVPRNVFAGTNKSKSDDAFIADATKQPLKAKTPAKGSREEWRVKMTNIRRQNLREGIESLRARQQTEAQRQRQRSLAKQQERSELLNRSEREDERLTAPSTSLDLDALFNKPIPDPTREARIQRKLQNLQIHAREKEEKRMEHLHSLYMNARDFIVTPQQLDKAVDEAFGTPENPTVFGYGTTTGGSGKSVWAQGRPEKVQDMLARATNGSSRKAFESAGASNAEINRDRIRRIAETLTGGKMEEQTRR